MFCFVLKEIGCHNFVYFGVPPSPRCFSILPQAKRKHALAIAVCLLRVHLVKSIPGKILFAVSNVWTRLSGIRCDDAVV